MTKPTKMDSPFIPGRTFRARCLEVTFDVWDIDRKLALDWGVYAN